MACLEEHKVNYATYMLSGEAETWWESIRFGVPTEGGVILWETFKRKFLDNYIPRDLRKKKAREFLELKQGMMIVGEYTVKFNELVQYWPHYQEEGTEEELCSLYESGLKV